MHDQQPITPNNNELPEQLWSDTCEELVNNKVGQDVVDRWLKDGRVLKLDPKEMEVGLPTSIHVNWVETYFRSDLEKAVENLLGHPVRISLRASALELPEEDHSVDSLSEKEMALLRQNVEKLPSSKLKSAGLNPSYSFQNFVVGENNQYCRAVAQNVAENPVTTRCSSTDPRG